MKALFLGALAASQAMPIIEFITADILRDRLDRGSCQTPRWSRRDSNC
jgi:hypothetical protein